ncbi:MAG: site-2 protease family protein [Acidocella sp.]|nr:site-2 protease family protein [Acidocella sp.]
MSAGTVDVVLALVVAVVLHELAHGVVARLLGDRTAQQAGRLTLNPIRHVDPMGSVVVPVVLALGQLASIGQIGFMYGWAKPVPVNPMALRLRGQAHPRQLMAIVALAGPVMNFALALAGALVMNAGYTGLFWQYFILVNLTLGLFNLLPMPPMDGGRILVGVLPLRAARFVAGAERYGILLVLLVLFVLPLVLGQVGIRFDPVQRAFAVVLPWAEEILVRVAAFIYGN